MQCCSAPSEDDSPSLTWLQRHVTAEYLLPAFKRLLLHRPVACIARHGLLEADETPCAKQRPSGGG